MKIQSLSIVVPTNGCVNNCKFCVSKIHDNEYDNFFDDIEIEKRLNYASNNGVNTCILTGTGEVLQNIKYLNNLINIFDKLNHPFPSVELQTTGVLLNNINNIDILKKLRVNTISLSISDIFDSENNCDIIGIPKKLIFTIPDICKYIVDNGFNLRLSLNMTNIYNDKHPIDILDKCKELGANQITFRKLYTQHDNSPVCEWVNNNKCNDDVLDKIYKRISIHGKPLYKLPFGSVAYSINGMSVTIDDDCMDSINKYDDILKYLILRENSKLYCQWDDEGSLIF